MTVKEMDHKALLASERCVFTVDSNGAEHDIPSSSAPVGATTNDIGLRAALEGDSHV